MGKAWRWIGLSVTALALWGCATAWIPERRILTGLVTDGEGKPVPRAPVLLVGYTLKLNLKLNPLELYYKELDQKELRTLTDEEGRYRLEFTPNQLGNNLFLLFYDKEGFDPVRLQKPEPLDVTSQLDMNKEVVINQVLLIHPNWSEVQKRMQEYGPSSDRGRILRQFGLPEKEEKVRDSEVWWYYSKGQSFRFLEGFLDSSFQFAPTEPPRQEWPPR